MPWLGETDTVGNVWRSAPFQSGPMTTGSIQGAWTGPDDDIDWCWTHTSEGSYISGYTVRRRLPAQPLKFEMPKENGSL